MHGNRDISRLRVLVGYLGERRQSGWWSSSFLDPASTAFIGPIFGNAATNARVVGVTEAARRIHDDAIGLGQTFHLFRLPEALEQEMHRNLSASNGIANVESVAAAIEELSALSQRDCEPKSGPVHIGALDLLCDAQWIPAVAGHYRAAFATCARCYPYFAG
nr:BrxE family protein [uncultured Rhodopila sp.]